MAPNFGGYYDFMKREIEQYKGEYDYLILYLPDFFKLLSDLMTTEIKDKDKLRISCTLAYFVVPIDVIPEETHGAEGLIDDIFLCTHVLNDIKETYGIDILRQLWNSDEDLEDVLEYTYAQSSKIIEDKGLKDEIFNFCGINLSE